MRLVHHVFFPTGAEFPALVVGGSTVRLNAPEARAIARFRKSALICASRLTGRTREEKEYNRFVAWASDRGLLFSSPPHGQWKKKRVTHKTLISKIEAALEMWKDLPSLHPLFCKMRQSPELASLYILDTAWFTTKASSYLGTATRTAQNQELKTAFKKLYSSEKNHYKTLAAGLGILPQSLLRHDPTSGARALYAHLQMLAHRDALSLLVSLGLFETRSEDLPGIRSYFQSIGNTIDCDLEAFIKHHEEDAAEGHVSLWKRGVATTATYDYGRASSLLEDLHTTKHIIELWLSSIESSSHEVHCRSAKGPIRPAALLKPVPELKSIKTYGQT